jgi:fumarylacetoacetate (FAA) hydrolase
MKLVMFSVSGETPRAGLLQDEGVYDLEVSDILDGLDKAKASQGKPGGQLYKLEEVRLHAPTPHPPTFRDFFAYEEHVANARRNNNRGEVPKQWYEIPVFYFSNPHAMYGPDEAVPYPRGCQQLDCEFEWALVIGKDGRNIPAAQADEYIAGFMLLNDWSARDFQMQEVAVGLGPAKGKDFATSVGPYLLTPDELADCYENGRYNLASVWRLNGKEKSHNNTNTQHYTFAQCIVRASANTWVRRGDVIGSGTLGNGCLFEEGPAKERWLQAGDVIELEIERLGILRNTIGPSED